ncbi:hypothetical protein GCM10017786_14950 [Amycolatopsis deserti]|uniref:Ethyl tert-butyl ether degradation protein EthD n=1 Tax=Amycolatopsis deserti TaxID=185696 RepID=A0ABQ3ILA9_9PSEU|nr:DUF4286 family protein [Amycolatopsis deserti]GHE84318.1 hypothetical protein GCM10017786_14950 [Amycolatopsis deserti]
MAKALLIAYVAPADDASEAEFNRWYDEVHIPQVVARIPGVVGGSRYRLASELVDPAELPVRQYLTIYELDTDDVASTARRLGAAATDGTLDMSDALGGGEKAAILRFYRPVR